MKTVRFAHVVANCGEPEPHLVLVKPAEDRGLQAAIRADRVMTVFQDSAGGKADHGTVGFEPGKERQFLIFPKSLRQFAGKNVVGIKYELLTAKEIPKSQRAVAPRHQKTTPRRKVPDAPQPPPSEKVLPFKPTPDEDEGESEEIAELKEQVKHAMNVLEKGKHVAAFNLLKRIVDG